MIPNEDEDEGEDDYDEGNGGEDTSFWLRISYRLELFDLSTIADDVLVVCPLAVVCWAMNKRYVYKCATAAVSSPSS